MAIVVRDDAGDLDDADEAEEEVDSCEQDVFWLNDQAPASPDQAGSSEGDVLGKRELLGRTVKVSDACNDNCPLHDRSPEMNSLDPNRTIPHPLEPANLLLRSRRGRALPSLAAIVLESTSRSSE